MRKIDEVKEAITQEIINLLESADPAKWEKGWIPAIENWAENPNSGTVYRGVNQLYLTLIASKKQYPVNRWLTFNQIQQLKANIKKGSKGAHIVYYKTLRIDDPTAPPTAKAKTIPMLKFYYVWNVANIEGLPPAYYEKPEAPTLEKWEKDQRAEELITATGAKINFVEGDRACYFRNLDEIQLPLREQFKGAEPFYSTAFHELAHWTGAPHRLNREKGGRFGDDKYAFEELVAELSAAFLCGSLGFTKEITSNAAYIKSWLSALHNEKDFIFKAATHAQAAADYIQEAAAASVAA
jgi:antirestriction protein ArdC